MLDVRWRGSSLPRKSFGWKERDPGERASTVGMHRPVRRTSAPVFVVRRESSMVGVPFKLRPQARGCTPREQGFTIRCFVDPGKPPCQGPPRPTTLTPAQPSRPETRPRACGPSSTRGSKPPRPPLLLAPCFLYPSPCSARAEPTHGPPS